MGVKIKQFDDPVCYSFHAKLQNNQLCYEIDLNGFANNMNKALKLGFRFILDYNEDRQVINTNYKNSVAKKRNSWFDDLNRNAEVDKDRHALIYLDTIGKRWPKPIVKLRKREMGKDQHIKLFLISKSFLEHKTNLVGSFGSHEVTLGQLKVT